MIRLTVRGLPHDITEFDIRDFFEEIGEVLRVEVAGNHLAAHPGQIAYVDLPTEDQAADAIRHLNHREIRGHSIIVDRA